MVCKNCLKFDNDLFEYKFNVFKDRHSLVLFFVKYCFKHTNTQKKKKKNGKKTVVAMERKFAGYARKFSGMFAVICTN